ncbi:mitochondrial import inner membrane translocase [Trichuris trichiura]|uniref:Mitochondrial import inner membrane translocase n=1 Tax=Trichuris trichiura TaxID=36087 RepID=A0A077ZL83_TRITR|nr:mitochondrial import inner membrane translocase [Trichuris trichiura]
MLPSCWTAFRSTIRVRSYCQLPKKNFLKNLVDYVQEELEKNKQLKVSVMRAQLRPSAFCCQENLKRLKAETDRLEQSETLKQARLKFDLIEQETVKSSERLQQRLLQLQSYIRKTMEEAKKTEIGQKSIEMGEAAYKTVLDAAETLEKSAELLSKTPAYRSLADVIYQRHRVKGAKTVRDELDHFAFAGDHIYRKPVWICRDVSSVTVHKDQQWYSAWKSWTESNAYIQSERLFPLASSLRAPYKTELTDWKLQYDESSNPVIRATRFVSTKLYEVASSLFRGNNISEVATEICKVEPDFTVPKFCSHCRTDIIPNVLEVNDCRRFNERFKAVFRGELEIVKDWCTDAAYAQLTHYFTDCKASGYIVEAQLLDIENVDVIMGKMTEYGPLLLVNFTTHQIRSVKSPTGQSMFGTSENPVSIGYIFVFCRNVEELDPRAAWKIMEVSELRPRAIV